MIRAASFCGVHGYKPTYGSIPRTGVFILSRRLDHIGVYARSLADLALIADVLMVHDAADFEMRYHAGSNLVEALAEPVEGTPRLGVFKGPPWNFIEDTTPAIFDALVGKLGSIADVAVPPVVDDVLEIHATVMDASATANPGQHLPHADKLLAETIERISVGKKISAADYISAIDKAEAIRQALDGLFDGVDALLSPAAPGEAPVGLNFTGDPVFQKIWTLTGMPTVTLPLMTGPNGMPIGLQVIGRRGHDAQLFRIAQWIEEQLA